MISCNFQSVNYGIHNFTSIKKEFFPLFTLGMLKYHWNMLSMVFLIFFGQGVSQKKTGDTPFRKNDAFSKPIGEYWNEPGPYELEDYPKM